MPRPERSLDPAAGPVQALAAELRELRRQAGGPTYREVAAQAGYSVATLADAAGGRRLPSLPVTLGFVRACGGDPVVWERRWRQASAEWAVLQGNGGTATAGGGEEPPYLGLLGYGVSDGHRFFGRSRILAQVLALVRAHRFVAVFGASGSGKSSLLRAGVVPAVERDGHRAVVFTPGAEPLAAWREVCGRGAGLVVVDQFEELFTLCGDRTERDAFIAELAGARVRVVVGVRADFYARCAESGLLARLMAGANVPVGPLAPDELREVVTGPARCAGLSVERALVTRIVADAEGQPGALPLVSHALLETWRHRRGEVLTVAGYDAAGGMSGAIAQTAESVYQVLGERDRATVRQVLTRLVTLGEGVPDTRRRARRDEFTQPGAESVLARLAQARLVVLNADPTTQGGAAKTAHKAGSGTARTAPTGGGDITKGDITKTAPTGGGDTAKIGPADGRGTVEIAHEALITAWPRLHGWLHADRDELQLHRRLTEASRIWQAHDRDSGALYRGAPLAAWNGRSLDDLNELERAFLTAGRDRLRDEVRSRRRRTRVVFSGLVSGVLALSVLTTVAGVQAHRANQQRDVARSNQLVAGARAQLEVDQETALLLAVAAYDTQPTEQAQAVLRQAVADSRVRATVPTGQGQVLGVAYSPDGRTVASTGDDGTVRLWRRGGPDRLVPTGRVLRGAPSGVQSPVFSRDGRRLAVAGFSGLVTVWDLDTGTPVVLRGHGDVVSTVAFSPDGRRVASASADGTVRIWDAVGRGEPVVLPVPGPPLGVAFSPDGRRLAVSGDGPVRVWDARGRGVPVVLAGHESTVKKVAFSPDGRLLASAGTDGTVRLWPVAGGGEPVVLHGDDSYVETVVFSPDGTRVASSHSGSNTIRVWGTAGDVDPVLLRGHDGAVWSLAFSPDGRRLASASSDGTVRSWDPGPAGRPLVLRGHVGAAWTVAPSADGRMVVSGGADGTVRVWREPWRAGPLVVRGHTDEVLHVAVSADGRWVASGSRDRTVRVWDARTGRARAVFRGHGERVAGVVFSPDGSRVASAGRDGTVRVWSLAGAAPVVLRGHVGGVRGIAFSPDGLRVASTGADGTVRIRSADGTGTPAVVRPHPPGRPVWTVAFSPDGRRLVTSGQDGALHLWAGDGQGPPTALRGHRDAVWSTDVSGDGRLLASSGQDGGGVRIWRVDTGREVVTVRGHSASVEQVRFAADGRLVSAHDDGTVRIWRCDVCRPAAQLRAQAATLTTRGLTAEELEVPA